MQLKSVTLAILVVETSCLVLLLRYSRTMDQPSGRYLSSTAVFLAEVVKLTTSFFFLFLQSGKDLRQFGELLHKEVWRKPLETLKMSGLAGLYTLQNNLTYLALTNLEAATYQVTYQMKIITTAIFASLVLHKRLSLLQWISLVLLMVGVALVQLTISESDDSSTTPEGSPMIGLLSVFAASVLSGFSGIYFEKVIKGTSQSLWIREVQLTLFGILLGILPVLTVDLPHVVENGFFHGFGFVAWCVVFLQAFGGLVVAFTVKYADNILKGFASSLSIVLSCVLSYYFLGDFQPTWYFLVGAGTTIAAALLYSLP